MKPNAPRPAMAKKRPRNTPVAPMMPYPRRARLAGVLGEVIRSPARSHPEEATDASRGVVYLRNSRHLGCPRRGPPGGRARSAPGRAVARVKSAGRGNAWGSRRSRRRGATGRRGGRTTMNGARDEMHTSDARDRACAAGETRRTADSLAGGDGPGGGATRATSRRSWRWRTWCESTRGCAARGMPRYALCRGAVGGNASCHSIRARPSLAENITLTICARVS